MTREDIEAKGYRVFEISAASGEGTRELVFAMAELVSAARVEKPTVEPQRIVLRPHQGKGGPEFTITPTEDGYVVRGDKPERWVRQTDFNNEEAVGYLADRLNRLGVETELAKQGAREGDAVIIGDPTGNAVVFDFRPSIEAGAEMLGRRGEDERLREDRPAAKRRRDIQEAMPERGENETRADVARRLDKDNYVDGTYGYEIGSHEDPDADLFDLSESDPAQAGEASGDQE